jgi:predicted Zn-dependent protease
MAGFFNTLKRQGEQSGAEPLPNLLSTHPDPGERNETVAKLAAEWKQKAGLTNPRVNREGYLRMIEGMVYGEDPREGFVEGSVFYHPELRFQFPIPQGWQHQNTPQMVQMAPQGGQALMMLMLAQGNNLQQAAQATMQQYQLQPIGSRETTINGLPALQVEAQQQQQQQQQQQGGQVLRTLSTFIQYNNLIYHFIGVSAAANYRANTQFFLSTMQNFRQLTDQAKLNRQPEKIRLRSVGSATTLEQALRGFGIPAARLNEFAILNGLELRETVPQGMMLKVIGQ